MEALAPNPLLDKDESSILKTLAPLPTVVPTPATAVSACGVAAIVGACEVVLPVDVDSDECLVGLEHRAVLECQLKLIGSRTRAT